MLWRWLQLDRTSTGRRCGARAPLASRPASEEDTGDSTGSRPSASELRLRLVQRCEMSMLVTSFETKCPTCLTPQELWMQASRQQMLTMPLTDLTDLTHVLLCCNVSPPLPQGWKLVPALALAPAAATRAAAAASAAVQQPPEPHAAAPPGAPAETVGSLSLPAASALHTQARMSRASAQRIRRQRLGGK